MGVIYTDTSLDAKTGIGKFTTVLNKLNSEFQKPKDDITQMQTRARHSKRDQQAAGTRRQERRSTNDRYRLR